MIGYSTIGFISRLYGKAIDAGREECIDYISLDVWVGFPEFRDLKLLDTSA